MNGKTGTRGGRDILAQEELFVSDEIEYPAPKGLAKTVQQEKSKQLLRCRHRAGICAASLL